ncbi:hypothetical protein [Rubrivirga sp. IMCC43871]|uniref:hypothetical protein n=1 Tax=Rubrivirga sp. IMCC43871 TaxID=3391575 RepID=UPI00398FC4FF
MLRLSVWPALALCLLVAPHARSQAPADDLDAFWVEAVRTVVDGDFDGYAALYHPDAVLVSLFTNDSKPIAGAFAEWKPYFDDTAAGRKEAGLEFRFTQRLRSETTAHETGMFSYRLHPVGEEAPAPVYIHFESLLVRDGDGWTWLMEYQKSVATADEWEAAAP